MGQLCPELLVPGGLYQEEGGRSKQERCGGEVDGVVAERHHNRHVHEQGHQKAEGEEDTTLNWLHSRNAGVIRFHRRRAYS